MKTVILAGGMGSRLAEETEIRPKPLVEIGGKPILWHIMNVYAAQGAREFVVALGYKGELIKEYFLDFFAHNDDITVDLGTGAAAFHNKRRVDWKVHLIDTGAATMTGGRLKRLAPHLAGERFMMTYGDGLADVDVRRLMAFHESHGRLATLTIVRPPARFGGVRLDGERVINFTEKPQMGEGWINGGFFVLEPGVLEYIAGDETAWEAEPLERLAAEGQLMAFKHDGFFQPMDTLREKRQLEALWASNQAPWKLWE
jgi:glucose-1-phosphate cytidylyltransferase